MEILGKAFNSLILTIMNIIKAGTNATIAGAMAMINAINGLASIFSMASQIISQIMSVVSIITQIMMIANIIQTAIEVATCGIGALITRVVIPVIVALMVDYAIPQIAMEWIGIKLGIPNININKIISVAIGGIPALIMYILEKIIPLLELIVFVKSGSNEFKSAVEETSKYITDPLTLLFVSTAYYNLRGLFNGIKNIAGEKAASAVLSTLDENSDSSKTQKELNVEVKNPDAEELYSIYLHLVGFITILLSYLKAFSKLDSILYSNNNFESNQQWDKIKCDSTIRFLAYTSIPMLMGVLLELGVEYVISCITKKPTKDFVTKLISKKFGVLPQVTAVLAIVDFLGEQFDKLYIAGAYIKAIVTKNKLLAIVLRALVNKKFAAGIVASLASIIIGKVLKPLLEKSSSEEKSQTIAYLSLANTMMAFYTSAVSATYGIQKARKGIISELRKLKEELKDEEQAKLLAQEFKETWGKSIKVSGKKLAIKIFRIIVDTALVLMAIYAEDLKQKLGEPISIVTFLTTTILSLLVDWKEDGKLSFDDLLTCAILGIYITQVLVKYGEEVIAIIKALIHFVLKNLPKIVV